MNYMRAKHGAISLSLSVSSVGPRFQIEYLFTSKKKRHCACVSQCFLYELLTFFVVPLFLKSTTASIKRWRSRERKNGKSCLHFTNIEILFRKIRFFVNDKSISNVFFQDTHTHTHTQVQHYVGTMKKAYTENDRERQRGKKRHMHHRIEHDNHYPTMAGKRHSV